MMIYLYSDGPERVSLDPTMTWYEGSVTVGPAASSIGKAKTFNLNTTDMQMLTLLL